MLPGRSPRRAGDGERRRIWPDIKAGIQLVWQDPVLRWATASTAVVATFCRLQTEVYFLFMTSGLHLRVSLIGLVFTVAGAIGFVSATLADRIAGRAGIGRLIVAGQLIQALGGVLLALAGGSHWAAAACIVASETSYSVGAPLFMVGFTSVRQARAPERDRGKVIGASRFLSAALMPVASLLGGVLGSVAGLRTALAVGDARHGHRCLHAVAPRHPRSVSRSRSRPVALAQSAVSSSISVIRPAERTSGPAAASASSSCWRAVRTGAAASIGTWACDLSS